MKKLIILMLALFAIILPMQASGTVRKESCKEENFTVSEKTVIGSNEYMDWKLHIPQIEGLNDKKLQERLNTMFESKVTGFKAEIEKLAYEGFQEAQKSGYYFNPYNATVVYDVRYTKNNILSLTMDLYEYTGGAHGLTVRQAYNINLCTGEFIGYKDIFKKGFDYKTYIVNEIIRQIEENPENFFPEAKETVQNFTDEQPFYITENGIVVFYGLYELAPYVAGIQEFFISIQ